MSLNNRSPTATLLEHALLEQGLKGVSKATCHRCLRPQNHGLTCANFVRSICQSL